MSHRRAWRLFRFNHFFPVLLFLWIVGLSPHARALVDLKNANYSDAWVDLIIPGSGYDLKVERAYNSRTLYNGIFGFGWCSDFETSLEVTPEGNLKLTECGAGLEVMYQAPHFSEKDIDKTVRTLMAKVKQENTGSPASYFADLEKRLRSDAALRGEYANKYGVVRPIADHTRFYANGKETDFIEKNGNYFSRTTADGSVQKFKLNGKLEKIYDRNGNYLTLNYDGKRLHDVTDNNGRKLSFSYYSDLGKVREITGPNNLHAEYKFKNSNLVWAKVSNGNSYNYDYDDLHNLTKITFPDRTTKVMTYNKNMDWITSYKDIDGCQENYNYQQSSESPKDHFWATVVKKCGGKTVLNAKYEFWYAMNSHRTAKYLKKSKTVENKAQTEVTYNELGKPLVVVRNGKTTRYEYYDDGLMMKKITPDGVVMKLEYKNSFKKVSKVTRGSKVSQFFYDSKGNLVKATNSDGQHITLAYDNHGRISQIEDQARRRITIKYEERFGKPSLIEREGLGSINVTYNSKGDIDHVASAAGSSVAVQVASTFSNLLDLIQPAGVNLTF